MQKPSNILYKMISDCLVQQMTPLCFAPYEFIEFKTRASSDQWERTTTSFPLFLSYTYALSGCLLSGIGSVCALIIGLFDISGGRWRGCATLFTARSNWFLSCRPGAVSCLYVRDVNRKMCAFKFYTRARCIIYNVRFPRKSREVLQ